MLKFYKRHFHILPWKFSALQGYWTVNFTPDNPGYLQLVLINWLNFTVINLNMDILLNMHVTGG